MEVNKMKSANESFTCGSWNITEEEAAFADLFGWIIQGILSSIIGCVGVFLSLLVAIVHLKSNLNPLIFNKLLILLSVFDGLFLLCSVYESIRLYASVNDYCGLEDHFLIVLYPLRKIAMCGSIYTTLTATIERHSAIKRPFQNESSLAGTRCSVKLCIYAIPTILISVLICVPLFFALKIYKFHPSKMIENSYDDDDGYLKGFFDKTMNNLSSTQEYKWCVGPTELRLNPEYLLWYNIVIMGLVTGVLPMFVIAILNFSIYKMVSRIKRLDRDKNSIQSVVEKRKKEQFSMQDVRGVAVLFGVVIVFLICHTIRIVLDIEELITHKAKNDVLKEAQKHNKSCSGVQFWTVIANDISHLLMQISSTSNFFIYYLSSRSFRKAICKMIRRN